MTLVADSEEITGGFFCGFSSRGTGVGVEVSIFASFSWGVVLAVSGMLSVDLALFLEGFSRASLSGLGR
jgi:hypothetical protein